MNTHNISFIVPAFNCADTIKDSIESIYKGNFVEGDEVVIINDASTDNTLEISLELQKKYPAITVITHNINKGSAAAGRNTGIDVSKNNLIFCLDSDNILNENSIPTLKKSLLENNADVAAFGRLDYFIKDKNKTTHAWIFKKGIIELQDALTGDYWPGPSGNYLFTKESWKRAGRYDESIGGAYDSWAFGIKQLATGSKMITLDNFSYHHRYGYESTFVRDSKKNNSSLIGLRVLIPFLDLINEEDVQYIFSQEHRYFWLDNLEKRPIRLKNKPLGKSGRKEIYVPESKSSNYKKYLCIRKYVNFIKRKLF